MKQIELKDIFILAGITLVFYGLFLMYPPAAWIVLGAFLVFLGWPKGGDST